MSNQSWDNVTVLIKYNVFSTNDCYPSSMNPANIPNWLLPLTVEEQSLLDLYDKVKAWEREAKIGASMAAKAKLLGERGDPLSANVSSEGINKGEKDQTVDNAEDLNEKSNERDEDDHRSEYHTTNTTITIKHEEPDSDSVKQQQQEEIRRRQNAKLESLRLEHDAALKRKEEDEAAAKAEEEMRQKLLRTVDHESLHSTNLGPVLKKKQRTLDGNETTDTILPETVVDTVTEKGSDPFGTSLKRKKQRADDNTEPETLTSSVHPFKSTNPLHDLRRALDKDDMHDSGTFIFPDTKLSANLTWSPPPKASNPQDGCLFLPLFNNDTNTDPDRPTMNTIAIKFVAPSDSKRFSFNITTPDNDNYKKVLFHFNPRQFQKGGMLVMNHKADGFWGQAITVPLALLPIMFGEPVSVVIQITNIGFDVFIQEQHCARMEHRTPLKVGPLILQFPSTDDYGAPENITVCKVWFGHKETMATGDLSDVFGVDLNVEHPKKLFVRGLTRILTDSEVESRRAELERAFKKYGGALGVKVTVSKNTTFAFVEVETEKLANLALSEMSDQFTMSKARRSRREDSVVENTARASADSWD